MYKPNFCAECGERVERRRWRVWTSRRFCAACQKRLGRGGVFRTLMLYGLLVLLGFAVGRSTRPAPPPLIIERRGATNPAPLAATTNAPASAAASANANRQLSSTSSPSSTSPAGADAASGERMTEPGETVSICGARTKKGTPCSRRVRGTGRCWQHRGKPAMLPAAKLIVQGQ